MATGWCSKGDLRSQSFWPGSATKIEESGLRESHQWGESKQSVGLFGLVAAS